MVGCLAEDDCCSPPTYLLFRSVFNKCIAESYLHSMRAHSDMTLIPVAHDNVLLIALPLNCVISPCQADNLSSYDVDMLMVTTIIQYNGSFGSHRFLSAEIKWLPHAVEFIFVRLVAKKTGILCAMLADIWGQHDSELLFFDFSCCTCVQGLLLYLAHCVSNVEILFTLQRQRHTFRSEFYCLQSLQ